MKRGGKLIVFLAVCASIVLLGIYHAVGSGNTARVSRVFDGDTIMLHDGTRVRLIGVDAPEMDSPYTVREPYGPESKAFLSSLVLGREVRLSYGDPVRDRYGRTLAYVYAGDVLVNGRMIREGWARAYRQYRHPWRDLFIMYEKEARSRGLGMWKDPDREGLGSAEGRRGKAP
ncbi:MAG TPA: thermonuclease family protein [Deltaproteobacteria bacterium]|nr:thermonuclease family protein [Deltaproteobacteria bacterium]HQI80030.1 thermonuclease family protein [Deltaproteobacteria bacterium]